MQRIITHKYQYDQHIEFLTKEEAAQAIKAGAGAYVTPIEKAPLLPEEADVKKPEQQTGNPDK